MISRGHFWKMFALTLFPLSTHQQKARLKCAPVCRQMSTTLNCALWFTFFIFPHFSQGSCIIAVFSCGFCPIPVFQSDNMFHLFRHQLRKLSERESCVSQSVGPAADNALADVALSQWFKFWTFFLCKAISHCLVNMKILLRFKKCWQRRRIYFCSTGILACVSCEYKSVF